MKRPVPMARTWADPLPWVAALLVGLTVGMPALAPLFAVLFPGLDRPVYLQDSFVSLAIAHLGLVVASSTVAAVLGVAAGVFVTRPAGADFRGLLQTLVTMGQTFPPVAVLAIAVPAIGFGFGPALIALTLYGLLPIVESTITGLDEVSGEARDAAAGLGMTGYQLLWQMELPLALPLILTGIRTSAVINVGTATIASTVGVRTLGLPIIVGLNGGNPAYVLQGAVLVALVAIVLDLMVERVEERSSRWRDA